MNKKRIIIVNNNLKVGGVQKSLINLLWTIQDQYDVTLCLFSESGAYTENLPPRINVIASKGPFRYLGTSQKECKNNFFDFIKRGVLALICKIFGRSATLKLMLRFERILQEEYDCAIAYLHNGREKSFYGGVQEYVLKCIEAKQKIAFLHCDYALSGANNLNNYQTITQFDSIVACSVGCKNSFLSIFPQLEKKCVTVRNCNRYEEILKMARIDTIVFNNDCINILTVSRLSNEKRIDRAISACVKAIKAGYNVALHILGDGSLKNELQALAERQGISDRVVFHGEQTNPYRFMYSADLLLVPSSHEAAPIVIDEALSLGLPILTTKTTSSHEMVTERHGGWVCENDDQSFESALLELLKDITALKAVSVNLKNNFKKFNNDDAVNAFNSVVTGAPNHQI